MSRDQFSYVLAWFKREIITTARVYFVPVTWMLSLIGLKITASYYATVARWFK